MIIEIRIEPTDKAKTLALLSSESFPEYQSLFTYNNENQSIPIPIMEFMTPGQGKLVDEALYLKIAEICRVALHNACQITNNHEVTDFLAGTSDIRNFLNQLSVAAEANELYSDIKVGKIYLHKTCV